ncbi:antibiotic biosynthesis monooxygenase [uncultured Metabacillus sp.]|nr:antibiotic biosynthesis monooxygenase [uncultured Metabacillus sp.]
MVFMEKWKDQAAIQQHEETSHFKKFVSDVEKYLLNHCMLNYLKLRYCHK